MKIGVLGGTFNPPHMGHLALAKAAQTDLGLDLVFWVPNEQNPFKKAGTSVESEHRLRMVQAMIAEEPDMAVSDIEITREGPSFMYETMEELQASQPGADIWLILGADNLEGFMRWHFPERILRIARLAVAFRPGADAESILERQAEPVQRRADLVRMEPVDLSSTEIRNSIAKGRMPNAGLHPAVAEYIEHHGLYR